MGNSESEREEPDAGRGGRATDAAVGVT